MLAAGNHAATHRNTMGLTLSLPRSVPRTIPVETSVSPNWWRETTATGRSLWGGCVDELLGTSSLDLELYNVIYIYVKRVFLMAGGTPNHPAIGVPPFMVCECIYCNESLVLTSVGRLRAPCITRSSEASFSSSSAPVSGVIWAAETARLGPPRVIYVICWDKQNTRPSHKGMVVLFFVFSGVACFSQTSDVKHILYIHVYHIWLYNVIILYIYIYIYTLYFIYLHNIYTIYLYNNISIQYIYIYISIHPSIDRSIYPSIHPSIHLSIYLSI